MKKIDFYELIDFQDIKSLLSPTSEEERAEYMEGFTPFQDEIDPIVDQWISILEGGAKVYWEDIMHDDVKGRKIFLLAEERRNEPRNVIDANESHCEPPTSSTARPRLEESHFLRELMAYVDKKVEELRAENMCRHVEVMTKNKDDFSRLEAKVDALMDLIKSQGMEHSDSRGFGSNAHGNNLGGNEECVLSMVPIRKVLVFIYVHLM